MNTVFEKFEADIVEMQRSDRVASTLSAFIINVFAIMAIVLALFVAIDVAKTEADFTLTSRAADLSQQLKTTSVNDRVAL